MDFTIYKVKSAKILRKSEDFLGFQDKILRINYRINDSNVNGLRPYQSNNLSYKYNSHSQIQQWIIVIQYENTPLTTSLPDWILNQTNYNFRTSISLSRLMRSKKTDNLSSQQSRCTVSPTNWKTNTPSKSLHQ